MSVKLKPLLDKVILQEIKEEKEQTKSGIILPTKTEAQKITAKVVAVGSGIIVDGKRQELEVKVGDTVVYSEYGAVDFKLNKTVYKIIKQSNILAIIER